MGAWSIDELDTIAKAQELELTALRADGTPREPITIWVVRNGDDLFIRSWRGDRAAWFRGAQGRKEGPFRLEASTETSGSMVPTRGLATSSNTAYRTKYSPVARAPMSSPC
jgi:hypothetical protein